VIGKIKKEMGDWVYIPVFNGSLFKDVVSESHLHAMHTNNNKEVLIMKLKILENILSLIKSYSGRKHPGYKIQ